MLRPMIFANITLASHATHVGLFAQLSRLPHSHFLIGGRLFRNADLTVLRTPTDFHSRSDCMLAFHRTWVASSPPCWDEPLHKSSCWGRRSTLCSRKVSSRASEHATADHSLCGSSLDLSSHDRCQHSSTIFPNPFGTDICHCSYQRTSSTDGFHHRSLQRWRQPQTSHAQCCRGMAMVGISLV